MANSVPSCLAPAVLTALTLLLVMVQYEPIDIHRSRPTVATAPTTLTDGREFVRVLLVFAAGLVAECHRRGP